MEKNSYESVSDIIACLGVYLKNRRQAEFMQQRGVNRARKCGQFVYIV